jgi:hypothetical protein
LFINPIKVKIMYYINRQSVIRKLILERKTLKVPIYFISRLVSKF